MSTRPNNKQKRADELTISDVVCLGERSYRVVEISRTNPAHEILHVVLSELGSGERAAMVISFESSVQVRT